MASRTIVGTAWGMLIVLVGAGQCAAQTPKAEPEPKKQQPAPAPAARNPAVAELAGQLGLYPARPSSAPDQRGLFVIAAAGGEPTLIANEPEPWHAICRSPAWSRDGKRIVFAAGTSEEGQPVARPFSRIKTLQILDGRLQLGDLGPGSDPDFSPTAERVIFFHANYGRPPEAGLWLMAADGSQREFLSGLGRPRWAPVANQFMAMLLDVPTRVTIVDVTPENGGVVTLADSRILSPPSWAGVSTIVAVIGQDKAKSIALLDVSQPAATQVKEILWKRGDGVDPSFPIYSPATGRCVFVGRDPKHGQALYAVDRSKPGPPTRLEKEGFDQRIDDLAFSPDGQYVLFCSDRRLAGIAPHVRAQSVDAPALTGITIDGDLKDWPVAMPRHAIENMQQFPFTNGPGPREHAFLTTSPDLSACFSVGYDPKEQLIYIAVIVRDDALIVGHTSTWDTDAVEIYVDGLHSETVRPFPRDNDWLRTTKAGDLPALEYIGIPGQGRVFGVDFSDGQERGDDNPILQFGDIKKTKTRMAFRRAGDVTTYEWAVQAFDHFPDKPTRLLPGVQIGLDVVVLDKDKPAQTDRAYNDPEPDRQAWVSWGPAWRRTKSFDAANLGEIILGRAPKP